MTFLESIPKILLAPGIKYLIKQYLISFGLMVFFIVSNINNHAFSLLTPTYFFIILFNTILLPYSFFAWGFITRCFSRLLRLDKMFFYTNVPLLFLLIRYVIAFGFAFVLAPIGFIIIYFTEVRLKDNDLNSDF